MKVNVRDMLSEGLRLKIAEDGPELQAIAGKMGFLIIPPVSAGLLFLKSDGDIFVRGDMNALLKLRCSRCLKEFEHRISSNIDIVYTLGSLHGVKEKEKELTREEVDTQYLAGDEIDIDAVLVEQLSLDMPMQPVCKAACKGLCPKCGRDLNQGECGCHAAGHIDSRFAKLRELKPK